MGSKEHEYWNHRYASGLTSGQGSVGRLRDFKWKIINKHIPHLDNVIDVGCGDLRFWDAISCANYTGIDISDIVIERDKIVRSNWKFICSPAEDLIRGLQDENVICLDMLFHIMNEDTFVKILNNLCAYSRTNIFIYNWIRNPFDNKVSDGIYQYFRTLSSYGDIFAKHNFGIVDVQCAPDTLGGMYLFEKGRHRIVWEGTW
jgi:hypothetical protein